MYFNEFNYMSAALEFFAAIVTTVMLIGCFVERKHQTKTGKFLIGVLIAHVAMLLVDAPIWILLAKPRPENVPLLKTLSFLTDASLSTIISMYAYCLTAYISQKRKISYRYANLITILCGIALSLWFINIFKGIYIYYDENGQDKTGPLYLMSQAFNIILPAMTMALAFRNRKILGWRDTLIMIWYGAIPVISIPLQYFWAVTPVCLATTVSLLLVYTLIHIEQAGRTANIEKELVQKELALSESNNSLVLSQIQPHFLYNALTSIYCLCDIKPQAAKEAVSDFSKYLRGNLDSIKQTGMIPFLNELNHLQAYLSLEKLRYDDDLEIIYDIKVAEFFIPPLTVQPLVENAVNHGISDLPKGGFVRIETEETPEHYEIRIIDNGIGFVPDAVQTDGRSHVGIQTVRSRLNIMCHGTLELISAPGNGTTAIIKIPKGDIAHERNSGR